MKNILISLILSVTFSQLTIAQEKDLELMKNSKQLTFSGTKSGEGYFSLDGKYMVFQSDRQEKNPFYQIYLMNLQTGETNRISTGRGKTTCAYIDPKNERVLFASTHLDKKFDQKVKEEYENQKNKVKAKYSWSFDDQFDIFTTDLKGKNIKQLTHERGYDAEASYSPDGKYIVFASNRKGYTEKLNEEEKKMFEQDPSYMMDIYIMNADGSNVRQLTQERGYDGGPFFSFDSKKILWRHFSANGQIAEVHVMNIDGSDNHAVTHLKAMSWAPFFHPSGQYIIFTTNKQGYENFELYIVDSDGKHEPVRVSFLPGFDGLPVFTPDGSHLAWTRKNEKGESQIYVSDWDHEKALQALDLKPSTNAPHFLSPAMTEYDISQWIRYLASEAMHGRRTGSDEEIMYTKEIASAFEKMGLVPADGKNFIQPFEFSSGVKLGAKNEMQILTRGKANLVALNTAWTPHSSAANVNDIKAPVAFVGYGINAPADEKQPAYDSYKDVDVQGKWALALKDIPQDVGNERRYHLNMYARIHHKAMIAKQNGAVGLIVVAGPRAQFKSPLQLRFEGGVGGAGIPVIEVTDEVAKSFFLNSKLSLEKAQEQLDRGDMVSELLADMSVTASVNLEVERSKGHNVVAKLKIPSAKSTVVVGAHGDHLGRGEIGNSLATSNEKSDVHFGADDNASGVSGVMELAHNYADAVAKHQIKLDSNLIFAVWSGEEIGILGATNFVANQKSDSIKAYVNMDMIGRFRNQLSIQGVNSAPQWKPLLEPIIAQSKLNISLQNDPYLPTDSMAFYLKNIPTVSFFTGAHSEYHTPRDRYETLNIPGVLQSIHVVKEVVDAASKNHVVLKYQKVEGSQKSMEGRGFRLYLGTIPDYTHEGAKGVKISGTTKDSPAEKAGLLEGDIIIELGGKVINTIYDYVYCLQSMKANEKTAMKVMRAGKQMDLSITPALKGM